jgi:hypothetical protein
MTLPIRPDAIFSIPPLTGQGTQNPNTKPTLQRAKNANALPTHPADEYLSLSVQHINNITLLNRVTVIKLITNSFLLPSCPYKKYLPTIIEERKTDTKRNNRYPA